MSELVISTAPAPQAASISPESIVLGLMLVSLGVLIGMAIVFAMTGRKRGVRRPVLNMAGAASTSSQIASRKPLTCTCRDGRCGLKNAGTRSPSPRLKCACRQFPEACEICCPLEGPPPGMPPDRRQ